MGSQIKGTLNLVESVNDVNVKEKVDEILRQVRNTDYKFTTANKYRSEINRLSAELRKEIVTELKSTSYLSCNADVSIYLMEILN